jgi:hypothetical protein
MDQSKRYKLSSIIGLSVGGLSGLALSLMTGFPPSFNIGAGMLLGVTAGIVSDYRHPKRTKIVLAAFVSSLFLVFITTGGLKVL